MTQRRGRSKESGQLISPSGGQRGACRRTCQTSGNHVGETLLSQPPDALINGRAWELVARCLQVAGVENARLC